MYWQLIHCTCLLKFQLKANNQEFQTIKPSDCKPKSLMVDHFFHQYDQCTLYNVYYLYISQELCTFDMFHTHVKTMNMHITSFIVDWFFQTNQPLWSPLNKEIIIPHVNNWDLLLLSIQIIYLVSDYTYVIFYIELLFFRRFSQ